MAAIKNKKVIHLDNKNNFFRNKESKDSIKGVLINDSSELVIKEKRRELIVDANKVLTNVCGQPYFDYNGTRYIIDDGNQNYLIRAGYFVINNFDKIRYSGGTSKGIRFKNNVIKELYDNILDYSNEFEFYNIKYDQHYVSMMYKTDRFIYTISVDDIESLVRKNNIRKDKELPFYPFKKEMDNYMTFYISIFCQELQSSKIIDKYDIADNIVNYLKELMMSLIYKPQGIEELKFTPVIIKRRILFFNEYKNSEEG